MATCSCGSPARPGQRNCRECHNRYARDHRRDYTVSDSERFRANVRSLTNAAIQRGELLRQTCEVCGNPKSHAHHNDYLDPMDVRWLCQKHHTWHHRMLKLREEAARLMGCKPERGTPVCRDLSAYMWRELKALNSEPPITNNNQLYIPTSEYSHIEHRTGS